MRPPIARERRPPKPPRPPSSAPELPRLFTFLRRPIQRRQLLFRQQRKELGVACLVANPDRVAKFGAESVNGGLLLLRELQFVGDLN